MNKRILLTFIVIAVSACFNAVLATPPPPDPQLIPIDGGVSLLVAVCAGYGAKKLYDSRKQTKAPK
jgi:hypothetical protein